MIKVGEIPSDVGKTIEIYWKSIQFDEIMNQLQSNVYAINIITYIVLPVSEIYIEIIIK